MGGVENINRLDPYELGSNKKNNIEYDANNWEVEKSISILNKKEDTTDKLNPIDDFFKGIKIIQQEKNIWLKEKKLQQYIIENDEQLKQLFKTPGWDKLLSEARRNYKSKDLSVSTKSNYTLQLYARYKLQDKTIAIDGKDGPQTLTTLRYLQSEGIWGEKVQWVSITEAQKKKIEEYKKNIIDKAENTIDAFTNTSSTDTESIQTVQNNTSNSHITVFSTGVPSIANKMQEINEQVVTTDRLSHEDPSSFLNDKEKDGIIHEVINNIVPSVIDQKKYGDYIQSNSTSPQLWIDPNLISQMRTAINQKIEKQAIAKKETISKYCKKEAYMTCMEWFENLLNGFHSDPAQIEKWKKELQSIDPNSVDFSWGNLRMDIGVWMEKLSFSYDVYTWTISAKQLIDKDPATGNIGIKNTQSRTLIQHIDPLDVVEKSIQQEIVSKDNSILSQFDQIQEQAWFVKADFIHKIEKQEPIISKTIESHYVYKTLLWWFNQLDPSWSYRRDISSSKQDNLYKIYDICQRSIHTYDMQQLQQFKNKLPDLQNIVTQYQQWNIQDVFWSKYLGNREISSGLASQNPEDSWLYLLFKNMTYNTSSPTWEKYNVINLHMMDKMIQHDHAWESHWFGNPGHTVLAEIDTYNAHSDADKLLESAYA